MSESKFKVGDRVLRVTQTTESHVIQPGNVYTVDKMSANSPDWFSLVEDANGGTSWHEDYFELAKEEPKDQDLATAEPSRMDDIHARQFVLQLAPGLSIEELEARYQWLQNGESGYYVELGDQRFTQKQWEAIEVYADSRRPSIETTSDQETEENVEYPEMTADHRIFYDKGVLDGRRKMAPHWVRVGKDQGRREGIFDLARALQKRIVTMPEGSDLSNLIDDVAGELAWPDMEF